MRNRGQSTLEYALIIAVALAALLAMQHYMRRGVEGKLRSSADSMGEQYSAGDTRGTHTTQQMDASAEREVFGKELSGQRADGVSVRQVTDAAQTQYRSQGADAEVITKGLSAEAGDESLFETQE